jgi:hypothetical protein
MLNRRSLIARGAIGAAAVALTAGPALGSAFALDEPGQLAALVHRYFDEVDAFNAHALSDGCTDDEADALAETTFNATLRQMIGVPARTTADALAALDWLIKEGANLEDEYGGEDVLFFGEVVTSLVDAIRDHIVSGRQA